MLGDKETCSVVDEIDCYGTLMFICVGVSSVFPDEFFHHQMGTKYI